jgi:hypothetical protein
VPSPFFSAKDKLTLALRTLRGVPIGVPVLFALTAFLVGYQCSTYDARASVLVAKAIQDPGINCGYGCDGAYEKWYRDNQAANTHGDSARRCMVLSFPVAMTLATILATCLGWLPNIRIRWLTGLGILYVGVSVTATIAMLSMSLFLSPLFPLGLVLALLAIAAYLYSPVLARAVMAGRDPSIRGESGLVFLALLLSVPLGVMVGIALHRPFPTFNSIYGIEVALGAVFGASLTLPRISPHPPTLLARVLPRSLPIPARIVLPTERRTVEHLVLALGAQIVVSSITLFQRASGSLLAGEATSYLIAPLILARLPWLILAQLPLIILIYFLLKRPDHRAYTFLTAALVFGIVETVLSFTALLSYRQIYLHHPIGLMWLAFSGSIYIITGILTYMLFQKTAQRPKLWPVMLGVVGMSFYFRFINQIPLNLISLSR